MLSDLQEKASSLERRLKGDLSQDDHMQELLKEVRSLATLCCVVRRRHGGGGEVCIIGWLTTASVLCVCVCGYVCVCL